MRSCTLRVKGGIWVEAENEEEAKDKGKEEARKIGLIAYSKDWGKRIEKGNRYIIRVRGEWDVNVVDSADADDKLEQKVRELEQKYRNLKIDESSKFIPYARDY